jgi:hypothetical protein
MMADIVLKDKNGNTNAFDGIDTISVPGHNDEGVAEDILFKKVVAGVVTGSVKMTSGVYKTKDYQPDLFVAHIREPEYMINSNGYWEKTMDAGTFKLIAGKKYYVNYYSNGVREAVAHSSLGTYGKCVTLGTEEMLRKNSGSRAPYYLIIYQETTNKLTIIAESVGSYREDDYDELRSIISLEVHGLEGSFGGMRIQHGGDTKPDAVFVMSSKLNSNIFGVNYAFWGIKSSLAHLVPNNRVAGSSSLLSSTSTNEPLDNSYNNSHLYCPDEKTFALMENSNNLVWSPNTECYWFAFWGIGDQSE